MPANGGTLILLTAASIVFLLFLILVLKLHAFVGLMITAMALGLSAGMPPEKVLKSIQSGFGEALGFVAVVIGLGAMIGRYLEYSGGGRALADWLLARFGPDRAAWAMLVAAFLVGIPIFFEVGVAILAPLVWNLTRETKRSLLFYGLPTAAALTVVHAMVPPHPAPAAAAQLLGSNLGKTILYGIALSLPMSIAAGIFYGGWIAKREYIGVPKMAEGPAAQTDGLKPPPIPMIILLLILPVLLIFGATIANLWNVPFRPAAVFLGHPFTALVITTLIALYFFGIRRGLSWDRAGKMAGESLAPMGALLCIIGGGGAFKQVIVDSGAGPYLGKLLITSSISPLIVVYLVALAMRVAQGSATVAIITAAGIVAPIVKGIPGYSPEILVLALACGGTAFSHVNDSGFWMVNQYFGMTVPQTLRSWTAMKVVSSLVGIAIVMGAHALLR
jgi:gluconate transporter